MRLERTEKSQARNFDSPSYLIGKKIPNISLQATSGQSINLRNKSNSHHLVLFFYPGDGAGLIYPQLAGCTREACTFQNRLHQIHTLNALVYGVSLQSSERQKQFIENHQLSFDLLSDQHKELTNQLRVPLWISENEEVFVTRTTFVVSMGGEIAHVFEQVNVDDHVDSVIKILTQL